MHFNIRHKIPVFFLLVLMLGPVGALARGTGGRQNSINYGIDYVSELQTNLEHVRSANLLGLQLSIPASHRLSLDFGSITTFSSDHTALADDLQGFSNIDNDCLPFALTVAGLNWSMGEGTSLFAGIRRIDEDYFCSDGLSFFTNSSCGAFPTISMNHDIAVFPNAAQSVHFIKEWDRIQFQASVYNGRGYNRLSGKENVFRVCPGSDGLFSMAQARYDHGKGQWYLGASLHHDGGHGAETLPTAWTYIEERISGNLTLVAAYSHAFSRNAACRNFTGLGGIYETGRSSLGLFTDYTRIEGIDEVAVEATCILPVTGWMSLQPVIHLISHPGHLDGVGLLRIILSLNN